MQVNNQGIEILFKNDSMLSVAFPYVVVTLWHGSKSLENAKAAALNVRKQKIKTKTKYEPRLEEFKAIKTSEKSKHCY